jgi:hypothetical protein
LVCSPRPFPDLQLKYLERLMQGNKLNNEQLQDGYKLKYLELKCKSQPDQVVQVIKTYVIPYEESLVICQKYRNLHGMAYIKSKIRNIGEALNIYMEIFGEMIDKYLESEDESKLPEAKFSYDMILEICKKESDEMLEEGIKYFDLFLNYLFDMYVRLSESEEEAEKSGSSDRMVTVSGLRSYIKSEVLDDFLLVYVSRAGTKGLIEVGPILVTLRS